MTASQTVLRTERTKRRGGFSGAGFGNTKLRCPCFSHLQTPRVVDEKVVKYIVRRCAANPAAMTYRSPSAAVVAYCESGRRQRCRRREGTIMPQVFDDHLPHVMRPGRSSSRRASVLWMLPMLVALAFITLIFLKSWQDAQIRSVPTVRVPTLAPPYNGTGQNGQ